MPYGTRDFLANPLAFMKANIVIPAHNDIGGEQASAKIHELCLKSTACVGKQFGKDLPVYMLKKRREADPVETGFYAYWCPYAQNQTFSCTLGNGARFLFTATMDGCSFGVGSQNHGTCRVAHSNLGGYGGRMEPTFGMAGARVLQSDAQTNMLLNVLTGGHVDVIRPTDYMSDADGEMVLKSTTFGIHELGRVWEFHTQKYWRKGNTFFLREVTHQV